MKVLHIWNTAGIGSLIAKYMDMYYDTESYVIMRKSFDPFNQTIYGDVFDMTASRFIIKALWLALRYDIIHVHALDKIVPILKFLRRKVVLHYHGTDIRGRWKERRKFWEKADVVLVSTKDLLEGAPDHVIYMPNPVDTDLFRDYNSKQKGYAFHISYGADDIAMNIAKELGLQLVIHDRDKEPIPHYMMPHMLNQYEYYIDIKKDKLTNKIIPEMSLTGLEALACGCKVVAWNNKVHEGLPKEYEPRSVVKRVYEIYKEVKK